ncbi:hypothetical protein COCCADRAFT_82900 [Bipolaris zeicola 26-R-13]|uniref:Transcription factor domain-containing protein n=1 Tax=Cochliobolus carbonum (strain 26-R-13) TaxID=930089 RepID=W6YL31_COCC2|nr:uncharacterized protein COCCADRAFT_82900 [Bipolaris zeicola 26-R-13]EUC38455.1 hypothetical protein COCCADRAFT_82900 [Bipolaris zeicola 26-R-13]
MAPTSKQFNVATSQRLFRENHVKKQATRRRGQRDGPFKLQLRFLTATNPSHFRNDDTRRSVRSHAMSYHRNKPRKEVRLPQECSEVLATKETTPLEEHILHNGRDHGDAPGKLEGCLLLQQQHGNETNQITRRHAHDSITFEHMPRSNRQLSTTRALLTLTSPKANSDDCDYAESQEERILRLFTAQVTTICNIGDGVDPFFVLPDFKHPEVNSLFLKRHCIRTFASDSFHVKWLPVMLSDPEVMLSSAILASVWLDMHSEIPGESTQTRLLKDEIIGMVNQRLGKKSTCSSDSTIMVVLHLLMGEISGSNEKALRVHERGIAHLLQHRGGLQCLGNEILAETCTAVCYHGDLICEAEPLPDLATDLPVVNSATIDGVEIPESPVFCPRTDFTTIASDSHCSTSTRDLLRDMRDLTDLFISQGAASETVRDTCKIDAAYWEQRNAEYCSRVTAIRKRLTSLPSAHVPDLPTSNDWIFEACRIAALIYTASILLRIPFSTAANPCRNPLVAESEAFNCLGSDASHLNTHLSQALFKILRRTAVADVWDKMSGVLYWVSTVGAAAARSSTGDDVDTKWVRRYLVIYSTRTMVKLVFDHAKPIVVSQKKLLKIQQLISRPDGRDVESVT